MDVVLLRFDAPLMSFGGVVTDEHNPTDSFPYRAMLAGLVANALGATRRQEAYLASLQGRIRYAARCDRRGSLLVDFQTVDLGPEGPMASDLGWTTRGVLEERRGGGASEATHIRHRHYLADAVLTVALTLEPPEGEPSLAAVSAALRAPARPLFLGRKCCLPSGPIWIGESTSPSLRRAIESAPRLDAGGTEGRGDAGKPPAIRPRSDGEVEGAVRLWPRVEDRDDVNAIHVGRRVYVEGFVELAAEGDAEEAS
jgi:CRISPR system Cascade subunit CasD